MMLLITLLIFSVALNIALIFGIMRKSSDADMNIIRMKEGLDTRETQYFGVYQSKSVSG